MDGFVLWMFAAVVGVGTTDMFVRAWKGVLGLVACLALRLRGAISTPRCVARAHRHGAVALLCGATLLLIFQLYLRTYGLGTGQGEQIAYFLAAVGRLVVFFKHLGPDLDELFAVRPESDD
jgi:hypothetical protein